MKEIPGLSVSIALPWCEIDAQLQRLNKVGQIIVGELEEGNCFKTSTFQHLPKTEFVRQTLQIKLTKTLFHRIKKLI